MTSHDPGVQVVFILLQQLVKGIGSFQVSVLDSPYFRFREEIICRVLIFNVAKGDIGCLEEVVLEQEVDQLKEDLIGVG